MLRPRRFEQEIDPGPVQIHARKVAFDVSAAPLHWIPGHPVASNMVGLLNVVLPAAERWFVATYNEALPLVKDPRLAEDMRGFIGQEATHADTHEAILNDFMIARGLDPGPILRQVDHVFSHVLAPSSSSDPRRRFNQLCDRLWLIAAIEHYTVAHQVLRARDSKLGLLPKYHRFFGGTTLIYFRPNYSPEEVGSTAQAVAYLASSPATRAPNSDGPCPAAGCGSTHCAAT